MVRPEAQIRFQVANKFITKKKKSRKKLQKRQLYLHAYNVQGTFSETLAVGLPAILYTVAGEKNRTQHNVMQHYNVTSSCAY